MATWYEVSLQFPSQAAQPSQSAPGEVSGRAKEAEERRGVKLSLHDPYEVKLPKLFILLDRGVRM